MSIPVSGTPAPPSRRRAMGRGAARSAMAIALFVALLWLIEGVDTAMHNSLDQWGIHPRDGEAVRGIAMAPLLHGGWQHLAANSVPALILGFVGLAAGLWRFLAATAIIWIGSGIGVWLTGGTGTVVIGFSGVLFGWTTYLIVRGLFTRRGIDLIVGVVLLLLYGGMLSGVIPGQAGISWQAHLWGAVFGVVAAVLLGRHSRGTRGRPDAPEVGAIAS